MVKFRAYNEDFAHGEVFQQLSLDCAIFGFHEGTLKVLLLKLKSTEY